MKKLVLLLVLICLFLFSGCSGNVAQENEQSSFASENFGIETEQDENNSETQTESESIMTLDEVYENFKNECLDVIRENTPESDENLFFAMQCFEDSFFAVKELEDYGQAAESETFSNFIFAISYFVTYLEEDTIGRVTGDRGWDAVESLMLEDGEFESKMDRAKDAYELTGRLLFEDKIEAGQYKVGEEIDPGEYVFFSDSSSGYFAVTSDANGDDIIENDSFDYNSIMTVQDGEYLELSRCYAVPIEEVDYISLDDGTMFKIGVHLDAGEYKLIADDDSGYYCIYADGRHEDIVANDNFEGQTYVAVQAGEYLVLSSCHIEVE